MQIDDAPDEFDVRELFDREELLRILDLAADSIVRFDTELRYDYVNDETVRMVGRPLEEWVGRTQGELGYSDAEVEAREARLRAVFDSGEPAIHIDQIDNLDRAGGESRWYESQLFPQSGAAGGVAHVVVISRDITERKLAEQALHVQARVDSLTGLANRSALVDELARVIEANQSSGARSAVLLVDLDHFKLVNDSLGHSAGDSVLQRAAAMLTACVRKEDLVARHGGDEFVVLLRTVSDLTEAIAAADRILKGIRKPFEVDEAEIAVTASIGVALTSEDAAASRAQDLLRDADAAMYVAKDAGRDGFAVYGEEMHREAQERFAIANGLRSALGSGELAVWYQPEVDLLTGEVRAVEALLRWHHPSGTVYHAGRFVEVAVETGLIVEIGYWVFDEVCASAARWRDHDLVVRFNLSPRQLADADLLQHLDSAMRRYGIRAASLCAEITETVMLRDSSVMRENLVGLSERGVKIAIDDFGTGYASLSYLRQYHVDLIKIDRSFIADIGTDGTDRALTAAVVALAMQLDIEVTAEGIEEPAQAEVLKELGCRCGQGFLYSPAVPAEKINAMLDDCVSRLAGDPGRPL
jgi:diguanylate cyclase (GGDEF)-like protein/PAS domain S-box-containing protein